MSIWFLDGADALMLAYDECVPETFDSAMFCGEGYCYCRREVIRSISSLSLQFMFLSRYKNRNENLLGDRYDVLKCSYHHTMTPIMRMAYPPIARHKLSYFKGCNPYSIVDPCTQKHLVQQSHFTTSLAQSTPRYVNASSDFRTQIS